MIETHCSIGKLNKHCKVGSYDWVGIDSQGRSGGIGMLPTSDRVKIRVYQSSNYSVMAEIVMGDIRFRVLVVYGRFCKDDNKELDNAAKLFDGDVIMGDFNKWKGPEQGFVDGFALRGIGGLFTRIQNESKSRLDRVLVSTRLMDKLQFVWHKPIPMGSSGLISDHKPIVFGIGESETNRTKEWRFPDYLLDRKDFVQGIRDILKKFTSRVVKDGSMWGRWIDVVKEVRGFCRKFIRNLKNRDFESETDNSARVLAEKKKKLFLFKQALEPNCKITKKLNQNSVRLSPDLRKAREFYGELYKSFDSAYVEEFSQCCSQEFPSTPKEFSIKSIKRYIKLLRKDISPGPLGITALFLQKFKKEVAILLKQEFKNFLKGNIIDSYWKEGKISLIPKKGNLDDIENWRPICVLNIEWKIYTGLINNVMYKLWEDRMSDPQIGFRKGRWIHENHLVLQAIIKNAWRKRKKKKKNKRSSGWLIFIDFKKAYDSVSHDWIKHIIYSLGGEKWERIITTILSDSKSKIKGDVQYLNIERGVRQGDPLSPLIFNLCLAPLIKAFNGGITILDKKIAVLAFADDLVVCCNTEEELDSIIVMLANFEKMTGLGINKIKTKALKIGNPNFECKEFENVESYCYLGLNIDFKGNINWNFVEEKIFNKLEKVRSLFEYKALLHRVRVINSYALSVAVYALRVANPPRDFCTRIQEKVLEVLGSRAKRVKWQRLISSTKEGGFGLFDLQEFGKRLKKGWLNYFYECKDSSFLELVHKWNEYVKLKTNKLVGPIFGKTKKKTNFWRDLVDAWQGVFFNSPFVGEALTWLDNDLGGENFSVQRFEELDNRFIAFNEKDEKKFCDELFPVEGWNIKNWRKSSRAKFIFKNKIIKANLKDKKLWKDSPSPMLTPAQTRWLNDGFNWLEWAKNKKFASRVKHWAWDAGNLNLQVRYKLDRCRCCGNIVESDHFIRKCPLISHASKFKNNLLFNGFVVWRIHACRFHSLVDINTAIRFACFWLNVNNWRWLEGYREFINKWLLGQKRLWRNNNEWIVKWEEEYS